MKEIERINWNNSSNYLDCNYPFTWKTTDENSTKENSSTRRVI